MKYGECVLNCNSLCVDIFVLVVLQGLLEDWSVDLFGKLVVLDDVDHVTRNNLNFHQNGQGRYPDHESCIDPVEREGESWR
jgi:hypothetical protein